MTEALAPVSLTASLNGVEIRADRDAFVPPFPGVTPPTTCVPYAIACCGVEGAFAARKSLNEKRVFSSTSTLIAASPTTFSAASFIPRQP